MADDTFRHLLLDAPEQILERVESIDAARVSELSHEQLCRVMEEAEYDPATAARESESGLLLDLDHSVQKLRRALKAGALFSIFQTLHASTVLTCEEFTDESVHVMLGGMTGWIGGTARAHVQPALAPDCVVPRWRRWQSYVTLSTCATSQERHSYPS